jgi:guanylate kinase
MEKNDFIVWASKLQSRYEPSDEVKQLISKIDLIAIVGPTGVGKSTIIENLQLPILVSDVTRDRRPDEKHSKTYNFVNDYLKIIEDIKEGNYVQFLISNSGEFYGTHINSYKNSNVLCMAIFANQIPKFQSLGFRSVRQFYIMPPSYVEWMRRIGGVRSQDLLNRISEAKDSILLALDDDRYNFILNDNLEYALRDVNNIISGKAIDQHRTDLAIGTADLLLEHIGED